MPAQVVAGPLLEVRMKPLVAKASLLLVSTLSAPSRWHSSSRSHGAHATHPVARQAPGCRRSARSRTCGQAVRRARCGRRPPPRERPPCPSDPRCRHAPWRPPPDGLASTSLRGATAQIQPQPAQRNGRISDPFATRQRPAGWKKPLTSRADATIVPAETNQRRLPTRGCGCAAEAPRTGASGSISKKIISGDGVAFHARR